MKKFITLLVLVLAFTANAMSQITTAGKPEINTRSAGRPKTTGSLG